MVRVTVSWGRRLQAVGALALLVSPFLAWARVPLLSLEVAVPGVLLHGAAAGAVGLLVLGLLALRFTAPGLPLALAAAAGAVAWWDYRQVVERTEYHLGKLQLSLAGLNRLLTSLRQEPIEIYTRSPDPTGYVGEGVLVAAAGCALVVLGALLEAAGYRGRGFLSVLLGAPRCRSCRHTAGWSMSFCPGCGARLRPGSPCAGCGRWLEEGYAFCPDCGVSAGGARREPGTAT